ncbi:MAG: glycosyltransferase [Bacilli bacterium]|jgi:1,2-diacylglycerol 3-alpha-glucosyltransferase
MKIGLFTDVYTPSVSGVVTSVTMLKNALEKLGHQVYIVTANLENNKFIYNADEHIIRIPGIKIGIYDYRLTGIYSIKAAKMISKWKLDVIHSHTEFGIGGFARIIAKQLNIPLVHTYHTMYEDYIKHVIGGYFSEASNKIVEYFTTFLCDKTISELIVPTPKTHDLFKQKYKITRNIHVIPSGIEIERFYKERFSTNVINAYKKDYKLNKDDFIILYLGRLGQEKNIEFMVENHGHLVKYDKRFKLLIVGDGPEMNKLKELVTKYDITDNVIFTGKIQWDLVPIYYQLADVFVNPSTSETQGLTVIEAMASSKPAICINDPSYNDMVINNYNGLFFNNHKEYLNIMIDLFKHPKKLIELGEKARESVTSYSTTHYAERVLAVYQLANNFKPKMPYYLIDKLKNMLKGE